MRSYGQYCPIARGAEIFAERWTPLIIRNLYLGCGSFSEILEGAPGLSRTLLSQRLKQLERLGIVRSAPKSDGRGSHYELTKYFRGTSADGWSHLASGGFPRGPRGCGDVSQIPEALAAVWGNCSVR